jgi:hypothetical protein
LLLGALLLGGLATLPVAADEGQETKALLDRAIKALGGEEYVAKCKAMTGQSTGMMNRGDLRGEVTNAWSVQGLDRFRWEAEVALNNVKLRTLLILNGDNLWLKAGEGKSTPFEQERRAFREEFYAIRLAEYPLALRDKAFRLSPLGEVKINDRPTSGLKVSHKEHPDLDLFFDKESGLPVQAEFRQKDDGGREVHHLLTFAYYKEVAGGKHFTKLTIRHDDKTVLEMERSEIKAVGKLDGTLFDRP